MQGEKVSFLTQKNGRLIIREEANKTIGGCVRTTCPDVFCRLIKARIIFSWKGSVHLATARAPVTQSFNIGAVCGKLLNQRQRYPHLPGVVRQPKETNAISNGTRPWKDDSWRASNKCKLSSRKWWDWEKKTRCYVSRFRPRGLLMTNAREAKRRILGLIQNRYIPELQGSSLICAMSDLGNDPCPCIMLPKIKAQTLLVSHQRDSVIKYPNCQTQCTRG